MTNAELIREVAEKVMGWDKVGWNGQRYTRWLPSKPPSYEMDSWNPLHDLNHAFMVVEKLREKGWVIRIDSYQETEYAVSFTKEVDLIMGIEGTGPEEVGPIGTAICLAALKALEKNNA